MFFSLFILYYLSLIKGGIVPSTVDCRDYRSDRSGKADDSQSSVACPKGFFLFSCSGGTNWKNYFDGTFTRGNRCYCQNGGRGGGCYAHARCCKIFYKGKQVIKSTRELRGRISGSNNGDFSLVTCFGNEFLTGCAPYTKWNGLEGACPGSKNCNQIEAENYSTTRKLVPFSGNPNDGHLRRCYAHTNGNKVYANAQCTTLTNPAFALKCFGYRGPKSGTKDDATSNIGCPKNYFLSGCNSHSQRADSEKAYIKNNKCYAQNQGGGKGVRPIAICCQFSFLCGAYKYKYQYSTGQYLTNNQRLVSDNCRYELHFTTKLPGSCGTQNWFGRIRIKDREKNVFLFDKEKGVSCTKADGRQPINGIRLQLTQNAQLIIRGINYNRWTSFTSRKSKSTNYRLRLEDNGSLIIVNSATGATVHKIY